MDRNKVKYFIIAFVATLLVLSPLFYMVIDQPSIHEATYEELIEIDGIGDTLANRVLLYLDLNKTCTIEDLEDIDGIGEVKLKLIDKKWGD